MLSTLIADGEVASAIADVKTDVTATIPLALGVGALIVAAAVGWRVAKRFFG